MSQPKEFTRIDLKLAGPGRSFQQTLKHRDLSWNGESHLFLAQLIIQFICCHCLVLIHVMWSRRESQARPIRSPPVLHQYQLASLDLGLVQYQYELKLFNWTIQSIDYKWRKYRLETYKFLLCTVLATVLYHMALKLPWGIYLLERVGVLLLSLTSERLISGHFFT